LRRPPDVLVHPFAILGIALLLIRGVLWLDVSGLVHLLVFAIARIALGLVERGARAVDRGL
jgi:hypothetical protein